MRGDVDLIKLVCADCPWFQTYERREMAERAKADHEAGGHRVTMSEFKGLPPRPINQTQREKLLTGLSKLNRRRRGPPRRL